MHVNKAGKDTKKLEAFENLIQQTCFWLINKINQKKDFTHFA